MRKRTPIREPVAFHIDPKQLEQLNALSHELRVPRAEIIRTALDIYLRAVEREREKKRLERFAHK
jgi:predicted DNA-binding protein